MRSVFRWGLVVLVAADLVAGGGAAAARAQQPTQVSGAITVSAAASLTEAFTELGADFERRRPGTTVTFNFGSSASLAQQIRGGAPADVFASADGANMQKLVTGGAVTAEPTAFASNVLTIVVKPGNPNRVKSLGDLEDLDVVSLCGETVPCGKYAEQVLSGAGVAIDTARTTRGADVKSTLAAVATGDADAAIVYASDAETAGATVGTVPIPTWQNAYAIYPIARISGSSNRALAEEWIDFTTSLAGRRTLRSFGFLPPPPSP